MALILKPKGEIVIEIPGAEFHFIKDKLEFDQLIWEFRTENGSVIKLFTGAALTASDGTLANAVTRIAELEARLQAHGLIS